MKEKDACPYVTEIHVYLLVMSWLEPFSVIWPESSSFSTTLAHLKLFKDNCNEWHCQLCLIHTYIIELFGSSPTIRGHFPFHLPDILSFLWLIFAFLCSFLVGKLRLRLTRPLEAAGEATSTREGIWMESQQAVATSPLIKLAIWFVVRYRIVVGYREKTDGYPSFVFFIQDLEQNHSKKESIKMTHYAIQGTDHIFFDKKFTPK